MLAATIKFHLQKEWTSLALHILHNIYVDNVLIGMDNDHDIHGVYEEAKHLFKKAAMNLREWNLNCYEFLNCLPNGERSITSVVTKVLGLVWDRVYDIIGISSLTSFWLVQRQVNVMFFIAKIFDPLGNFFYL